MKRERGGFALESQRRQNYRVDNELPVDSAVLELGPRCHLWLERSRNAGVFACFPREHVVGTKFVVNFRTHWFRTDNLQEYGG